MASSSEGGCRRRHVGTKRLWWQMRGQVHMSRHVSHAAKTHVEKTGFSVSLEEGGRVCRRARGMWNVLGGGGGKGGWLFGQRGPGGQVCNRMLWAVPVSSAFFFFVQTSHQPLSWARPITIPLYPSTYQLYHSITSHTVQ
jgi:hypothetical protein